MKSKALSWFPGAGAAAWIFLAACQQPDSPALSAPSAPSGPEASNSSENAPTRSAGPGIKPSEEELALFLKRSGPLPAPVTETTPAPLAKAAAALPLCRVHFNGSASLGTLPDQANMGFAFSPFYRQTCNTDYTVLSGAINQPAYRLIPEKSGWCPGTSPNIGTYNSNGDCLNQTQGKLWGRRFGNDANGGGVSFNVINSTHYRNFEFRGLYVHSGVAEVWGLTPAGGWVSWPRLTAGWNWTFPPGTTIGQLQIFDSGRDGRFLADNLDIAIHP